MSRARVVLSFARYMPMPEAHAMEHACQAFAQSTGWSYERSALRSLYLFENGHVDAAKLRALGAQAIVSAPIECLVERLPARAAIEAKEDQHRLSAALLKQLVQGQDVVALPDAGLRCKQCKSNDIKLEFLQTRSADEGTTIFCTCNNVLCKKRWKM